MESKLAIFEDYKIRRVYDEDTETRYFSVVDIIQVLLQQPDYQTARKYWNKMRERLSKEGSESVTNCHRLKLEAADGEARGRAWLVDFNWLWGKLRAWLLRWRVYDFKDLNMCKSLN